MNDFCLSPKTTVCIMLGQPFDKITTVLSLYQSNIQVINKAGDSLAIYFTPVTELSTERSNICAC